MRMLDCLWLLFFLPTGSVGGRRGCEEHCIISPSLPERNPDESAKFRGETLKRSALLGMLCAWFHQLVDHASPWAGLRQSPASLAPEAWRHMALGLGERSNLGEVAGCRNTGTVSQGQKTIVFSTTEHHNPSVQVVDVQGDPQLFNGLVLACVRERCAGDPSRGSNCCIALLQLPVHHTTEN